jgi:hypothetical protein
MSAVADGVLGAVLRELHKTNSEKAKRRLCRKCDDQRPVVAYAEETGDVQVVSAGQLLATNTSKMTWLTPDVLQQIKTMECKDILVIVISATGDVTYRGYRNEVKIEELGP